MGEKGLLGIFPDMEDRVNKRMKEVEEKLSKAIAEMSREIRDAAAPLIRSIDKATERNEILIEELKKLRTAVETQTEEIKKLSEIHR